MSQRFDIENKHSPMSRRKFLAASAGVPAAALSACTSQSGSKQVEPVGPARLVDAAGEKVSFFAGERPLDCRHLLLPSLGSPSIDLLDRMIGQGAGECQFAC